MPDTIRLQCLEALKGVLEDMVAGEPMGDPYSAQFTKVVIGPLDETDHRMRFVAGIVTGREKKRPYMYPLEECTLPVAIELCMTVNADDDDPGVEAERLLGEVQRKIHEDTTLGGVAVDLRETGNEIVLDMYGDRTVVADIFLELIYRHRTNDPREAV
jgi:hypothetical protein